MYARYSPERVASAVITIGTSHSAMASTNAKGASQKRRSRACSRTRGQCSAEPITAGTIISSAITPTPLVITPMPAKNQPSHHQRQAGPSSRWRSRP
ncbi:hypothetical protein D3C73_1289550 [compost metagenome]